MPTNILNAEVRKRIIDDIFSEENKRRKVDSFRRLDIYKKNQRKYILERIQKNLSAETLANMRTFTSINFTKKIIDAKASVYKTSPKRLFANANEREQKQIDALYEYAKTDIQLKKANRMFKLEDQASVQVLPKDGCLHLRVLAPHHFDVVPSLEMPDGPGEVYILSGFNKQDSYNDTAPAESLDSNSRGTTTLAGYYDTTNQKIADREDYFDKLNYFVFWSKEYHFATNKSGAILDKNNNAYSGNVPLEEIVNPIGKLPFIDLVAERDFEYWAQTGSNITDTQVDIGCQISDTVDVNFRQSYSQAILSATEAPKSMQIGPHTLLFLKKDPRGEAAAQPEFEFATPSPDLASSIRLTEMILAMSLTSEGMDASAIATGPNTQGTKTYTSGYERMLAQMEEFTASQDDFQLFENAEEQVFDLLKAWSNVLQNVKGPLELKPELRNGIIGEQVDLDVVFSTPQMVQSKSELEDSAIKKMEAGLMSRKRAVMDIYEVDEDKAEEIITEIDEENLGATDETDPNNPNPTPPATDKTLKGKQTNAEVVTNGKGMDAQYS